MIDEKIEPFWDGWQHIYPINDIIEHNVSEVGLCQCNPTVDHKNNLVIHHALDGRRLIYSYE